MTTVAKKEASLLLTVSPGTLGLVLKIDKELGGATVTAIDSKCTFQDRIEVGDRIITIDDHDITGIDDFSMNKDKTRKLGIAKKKNLESALLKTIDDLEQKARSKSGEEADELQSLVGTLTDVLADTIYKEEVWTARLQAATKKEEELNEKLKNAASQYRDAALRADRLQKVVNALKSKDKLVTVAKKGNKTKKG